MTGLWCVAQHPECSFRRTAHRSGFREPGLLSIARAFGFQSERVKSAGEFRATFASAVKSRVPWMVVVDSDAIGPENDLRRTGGRRPLPASTNRLCPRAARIPEHLTKSSCSDRGTSICRSSAIHRISTGLSAASATRLPFVQLSFEICWHSTSILARGRRKSSESCGSSSARRFTFSISCRTATTTSNGSP